MQERRAIILFQRDEALGDAAAGGTMAMEGWVNGAGRLGIDAGPEGGARFIAGPDGASGTDAGGTGGGRSENICAEAEVAISETRIPASASAGSRRPPRPDPSMPLPPGVMVMLFTENAANSSLPAREAAARGTGKTPECYSEGRVPVTIPAQALRHKPCLWYFLAGSSRSD